MSQPSCEDRIDDQLSSTIETVRARWDSYCKGEEDTEEGTIHEYGLSFDYNEDKDCFIWLLSWGGPQDEFRFFASFGELQRVEYGFLDWYDGATRHLKGEDLELLSEIWEWFTECGSVEAVYKAAVGE